MTSITFNIKVTPEGTGFIVESEGFKPEVFLPVVLNNRIRLVNPINFNLTNVNNSTQNKRRELVEINNHVKATNVTKVVKQEKVWSKMQGTTIEGNNKENSSFNPNEYNDNKQLVLTTPVRKRNYFYGSSPSIVNWRKCLTPIRTYSKRAFQKIKTPKSVRKGCYMKWPPYERSKATQGIKSDVCVLVKKIKAKVDKKIQISPAQFRKNMKNYSDIIREGHTIVQQKSMEFLDPTQRPIHLLKKSTRSRCLARKLEKVFASKCYGKDEPIEYEFKKLCTNLEPLPHLT